MKEKKIIIKNKLGLHARAAAKIVTLTNKYNSKIKIVNGAKIADAKSIMIKQISDIIESEVFN